MTGGTIAFGFAGNPKEPSAMRGGPMFELLFGLDTWLRKQGKLPRGAQRRRRITLREMDPYNDYFARQGRFRLDAEIVRNGIDFNNLTGFTNDPRIIGLEFVGRF